MKKIFLTFLILIIPFIGNATTMLINGDGTSAAGGGYATPAHVQSNSGVGTGPVTTSGNATSGNTIVVWISGLSTLADVSLSGCNVSSWTGETQVSPTSGLVYGRWYHGITTGGACSITFTEGISDPGWSVYEISGLATSSSDQLVNGEVYFDGTWETAVATTTLANEALLCGWGDGSADPEVSYASGWGNTTLQNTHAHGTALKIVSSTGTYTCGGTDNTSGTYGGTSLITLKAAAL